MAFSSEGLILCSNEKATHGKHVNNSDLQTFHYVSNEPFSSTQHFLATQYALSHNAPTKPPVSPRKLGQHRKGRCRRVSVAATFRKCTSRVSLGSLPGGTRCPVAFSTGAAVERARTKLGTSVIREQLQPDGGKFYCFCWTQVD